MDLVNQIIQILRDGRFHSMSYVKRKVKGNPTLFYASVRFLTKQRFCRLQLGLLKLETPFLEFLNKLDRVEKGDVIPDHLLQDEGSCNISKTVARQYLKEIQEEKHGGHKKIRHDNETAKVLAKAAGTSLWYLKHTAVKLAKELGIEWPS